MSDVTSTQQPAAPVTQVSGDAANGYIVQVHDGVNAGTHMPEGARSVEDAISAALDWFRSKFTPVGEAAQGASGDVVALSARVDVLSARVSMLVDRMLAMERHVSALGEAHDALLVHVTAPTLGSDSASADQFAELAGQTATVPEGIAAEADPAPVDPASATDPAV